MKDHLFKIHQQIESRLINGEVLVMGQEITPKKICRDRGFALDPTIKKSNDPPSSSGTHRKRLSAVGVVYAVPALQAVVEGVAPGRHGVVQLPRPYPNPGGLK